MLASALAAGSLAACGSDSGTTDTKSTLGESSNGTSGSGNTEKTSDGKTKISIYHASWMLANPDSAQVQKVQDAINAYIGDKINVEVELHDIASGEFNDKANLALANNEINLLTTASWQSTIGTDACTDRMQSMILRICFRAPRFTIHAGRNLDSSTV